MKFDQFYLKEKHYFSQNHSEGMAECLQKFGVMPCRALDVGAGEGRNSIYLASIGFKVTALEPSNIGAKKIIQCATDSALDIEVINNDFLSESATLSDIGFVVALTSLEHMEYGYLLKTVEELKRIIIPGGYIYIVAFTEEDPGYSKDYANSSECALFIKHYFRKNELRSLFADFEILEYSEYTKEDTTHGPVHYHGKVKLFARKPL